LEKPDKSRACHRAVIAPPALLLCPAVDGQGTKKMDDHTAVSFWAVRRFSNVRATRRLPRSQLAREHTANASSATLAQVRHSRPAKQRARNAFFSQGNSPELRASYSPFCDGVLCVCSWLHNADQPEGDSIQRHGLNSKRRLRKVQKKLIKKNYSLGILL
jgi:hypothetical protein